MLFRSTAGRGRLYTRLQFEQTDPQTYVGECSNGIFSLLKKEYDTPRNRARSAPRASSDAGDARAG